MYSQVLHLQVLPKCVDLGGDVSEPDGIGKDVVGLCEEPVIRVASTSTSLQAGSSLDASPPAQLCLRWTRKLRLLTDDRITCGSVHYDRSKPS